jgi:DNA-binding CsgD family transcriptional regulator
LMGEIGIHRRRHQAPFTDGDRATMAQLYPHIQRTLQVQHRLGTMERERALTLDMLEGLAIGVIIVDMKCRVLFSNTVAERALRNTGALTVSNGCIATADQTKAGQLGTLVTAAAKASAGIAAPAGGVVTLDAGAASLSLLISPLRSASMGFGPRVPAAAIIFSEPGAPSMLPEQALAETYGLTPAEAQLLAALANGHTLSVYADLRGITIGTARSHLKAVLLKSGFHRQVDLVRAVSGSPVFRLLQAR